MYNVHVTINMANMSNRGGSSDDFDSEHCQDY